MKEIIVEIGPDGLPKVSVKGIKGRGCKAATEGLERALGATISSTPTAEMQERIEVRK